jgi:hypothetical protein
MKKLKIVGPILVLALTVLGATLASALALGWGMQTPYSQSAAVGNIAGAPQTANQILAPITQTNTQTPTLFSPSYANPQQYGGWGRCLGRLAGAASYRTTETTTPLSIAQAAEVAKTYVASLNNPDLAVKQIEEYANNFYVPVTQVSTGNGAFELLINKATGKISAEPGPNMMWNTQYTFKAGWCSWAKSTITALPALTVDQAKTDAQQYLNAYLPGTSVGDVLTFSGHYTIEVLSNESPYGMLSVNSYTGQVWHHTWHGAFIQEQAVN